MAGGGGQARRVGHAPGGDAGGIRLERPPQTGLAPVRTTGGSERLFRDVQPGPGTGADGLALHFRDLRQHREDQEPRARRDRTEPAHHDLDALVHERADRHLDIQRITAQPVDGGHVQPVALTDIFEHRREARPASGQDRAADALVFELLVEGTAHRPGQCAALRRDRLASGRHAIVGNITHSFSSWGERYPSTSKPSSIAFFLPSAPKTRLFEVLAQKLQVLNCVIQAASLSALAAE